MKIHLHIVQEQEETEIHIYTSQYTKEIEQIMQNLKINTIGNLIGYVGADIHVIRVEDVFSIIVEDAQVFIFTDENEYESKLKLYEIEKKYSKDFIRINKSTLVAIKKISSIQSKTLSNPIIHLENGMEYPVGRKYFRELKENLGLGRERE